MKFKITDLDFQNGTAFVMSHCLHFFVSVLNQCCNEKNEAKNKLENRAIDARAYSYCLNNISTLE